ncbi:MAG: acetate--CoA ligase family protein [Candidatus Diapherotrites archaeon]|nr:acetate--CoA ligase family protein [Candidatus Diapherotrites archaeon]
MPDKVQKADLEKLFNPRTVCVIGASNTPGKVGYSIIKNLIEAGYFGEIIPINMHEEKVQGIKAYESVLKVSGNIDCAIIAIPAKFVGEVLEECVKKSIKNAIIITAGFSETNEEGKKIEEEIKKIIASGKMSIVGPNTLGIINTENGFNASFSPNYPHQGNLALVSQSGALCTAMLDWARQEKIGFSKIISTGNKTFLNEAQYFDYLANDPRTKAVLVYMESVKEPKEFIKSTAKLAAKKPIVLIKAGRSKEGQKAALSHTGAMSVDDEVFTVACKKAGAIRVNTLEGLFDMAKLLSKMKKMKACKIAIVTNAGGPGVITADAVEARGMTLSCFSQKTIQAIREINPHASNPFDLIGDAKPIDYRTAIKTLIADPNIDIVYTLLTPQSMTNPERVADIVVALNKTKPIICSFIGGTLVSHPRRYLKEHGVIDFDTPERGIKALSRLCSHQNRKSAKKVFELKTKPKKEIVKAFNGKKQLSLEESFKILGEYGVKTPKTVFIKNKSELINVQIAFPVVLKIANGFAHKTDYGLIKTGIQNKETLEKEFEEMSQKSKVLGIEGIFVVEEMIKGQEVLVSAIETEFGKTITYGLGGIFVEALKDYSQKIAPLNDDDIEEILLEVKATKALLGMRTKKKYDIEGLKKLIKSVSLIAQTYPKIKELELNPVIVTENGCYAVDAVITIE